MEARIFNLQKFSLNDGPGIRTVVFLKGCPLRCAWCANPEGQHAGPQVLRDAARCAGCGKCAEACPTGAATQAGGTVRFDAGLCAGCGECAKACPGQALRLDSRVMTVPEVLEACRQDTPFYEESGGGITLSGGEVLFSAPFAAELLRQAREEGLDTAIETSCFAPAEAFDAVAELADHILADMKHWDDARHREGTGAPLRPVLENISRAIRDGRDVLVRIPVIPGFNDSPADAGGFSARLRELGTPRVQLLPFHQLGEGKYAELGLPYGYEGRDALHEDDLVAFRERLAAGGVEAFL